MEQAKLTEMLISLVKSSGDMMAVVENGQCIAASKTAVQILGSASGSINERLEAIVPPKAQSKLKAAWTRAGKRPVSSATISPAVQGGSAEFQFYGFGPGLHLLRLDVEATAPDVAELPDAVCHEPSTGNVLAGSVSAGDDVHQIPQESVSVGDFGAIDDATSHPDLPAAYGREGFFAAAQAIQESAGCGRHQFAVLTIDVTGRADNPAYWRDCTNCKTLLVRINDVVRGHDTIAHLAGPRFGIIQRNVRSSNDVDKLQQRIVHILCDPFTDEAMPPQVNITIRHIMGQAEELPMTALTEFIAAADGPKLEASAIEHNVEIADIDLKWLEHV